MKKLIGARRQKPSDQNNHILSDAAAERYRKYRNVAEKYRVLIDLLNRLGYYPKSREEAKRMARQLLDRGWEE